VLLSRLPAATHELDDQAARNARGGDTGRLLAAADSIDVDNDFVLAALSTLPADARYTVLLPPSAEIAASTYGIGALTLWLSTRDRELPVLYLVASALAIAGFAWVIWSDPSLPISAKPALTPIPRAVGAIALLSIALAPLLFDPLLRDREGASHVQQADPS
jgi:hypothetical protein